LELIRSATHFLLHFEILFPKSSKNVRVSGVFLDSDGLPYKHRNCFWASRKLIPTISKTIKVALYDYALKQFFLSVYKILVNRQKTDSTKKT